MATVHTAYGPGEIVDRETVRGRTQYKVAGDGFEVWLDEAKLGGYVPSDEGVDLSAPHWQGYDLGDKLTGEAFGGGYPADGDLDEYTDPRGQFDRNRMRTHEDYDGYGEDETERYARRLAWAPMDRDNSTELPYNPEPQHDAVGQNGYDDGSSTLQPTHHIDADERLHSSDSVSFEDEGDGDEPGPNPDLFARNANFHPGVIPDQVRNVIRKKFPVTDKLMTGLGGHIEGEMAGRALNMAGNQVDQIVDMAGPGPGWGDLIKGGSRHEANPAALLAPALLRALGPAVARGVGGSALSNMIGQGADEVSDFSTGGPDGGWGDLVKSGSYRPAGLSDRYIDITAGADYHNDPVAQFRHDPDAYINRIGHLMDEGLNPRFAEYMDLVEADSSVRTAAWKDVRKKAMRLKTSGAVHVKDLAPSRIMASVDGDHGTYDVVILKGASYGDQSIANWHCGCEWGKWAFRRKFSYVGRLCSHAYASYLTMQSAAVKGQPRTKRGPSDMVIVKRNPRDRQYPMPVFAAGLRTADNLQEGPQRLTPDMVVNDTDDAQMFLDVTKDERKDTGPDDVVSDKDIVHFARLMRHCEVTQQPYPRQLVAFLARYAGCNDDSSDDTQADYQAHDADDANEYLQQIRSDADRKQEEDFGSMAERVHKIQDAVEEARAHGADADRFVASRRVADVNDPNSPDAKGFFKDKLGPAYTGPGSKYYNAPYSQWGELDKTKPAGPGDARLDAYGPNGINKSNPGGSNGPHGGAGDRDRRAEQQQKFWDDKASKGELPDSMKGKPGGQTTTDQGAGENQNSGDSAGKGGSGSGGNSDSPGKGGSGGGAPAPSNSPTSGNVADGGVAGAENGNNSAIGKDQLDADGYYTVQKGDTLTDIAQRAYGDMNKYQDLAKGNSIANPDVINEGQRIKIENPTGNNGLSGDKTNPAGGGSDGNIATPETATPAATTDAVPKPAGGDTPAAPAPAQAPAAPLAAEKGFEAPAANSPENTNPALNNPQPIQQQASRQRTAKEWLKWAAGEATNPADPENLNQGQNGVTNTTSPSTPTPATADRDSDTYTDPLSAAQGIQGGDSLRPSTGMGSSRNDGTQAQPGTQSRATPGAGGGGGIGDTISGIGSGIGDAVGAFLPGLGGAISGISNGIGSAIDTFSGMGQAMGGGRPASGTSGGNTATPGTGAGGGGTRSASQVFASQEDFDDWVRYAYPTADGEGKLEPHTHPFAGSGYPGPLEIGTSEDYADKARKKHDDVTDLGDDPLSTPMGKWQRQSAHETVYPVRAINGDGSYDDCPAAQSTDGPQPHEILADGTCIHCYDKPFAEDSDEGYEEDPYREASIGYSTDDDSDIVRTFQAHLGETALGAGAGQGAGRFDDIAGAAQGFLRTAGRNYSLAEQSELIREGDKGGARNLDSLDLKGTHYEDMQTLGW